MNSTLTATTLERPTFQTTENGTLVAAPAGAPGPRGRSGRNLYRTTARVVGVVYLAGFVVGMLGNGLIQSVLGADNHLATVSANSLLLAFGAILWLAAVAGDTAHGVLMFPILKQHGERIALGYLAARIVDAVFTAVMVVFLLLQLPLGSEFLKAAGSDTAYLESLSTISVQASQYAYQIGMSTLGLAGLMLNYTLYRAKLVPRPLAIWGLVGNAIICVGMLSDMLGSGLGLAASIPGGLWEVFIGVWLIAKGFSPNPSAQDAGSSPA